MPLYRCTSPTDLLDHTQRQAMVDAFTTIHCEVTGAPPTFVHVQFHDATGAEATPITLHGGIREGRSEESRREIIDRCVAAAAEIADRPASEISMRTSSTPASWIFEGGRVMPEPGDEAAWLAEA